jgi:hypothetical protein
VTSPSSPPTTSTTTTPAGGRSRTCSPACATGARSSRPATSYSPTASDTSSRRRRWPASSATTRAPSAGRWRSPSSARFR